MNDLLRIHTYVYESGERMQPVFSGPFLNVDAPEVSTSYTVYARKLACTSKDGGRRELYTKLWLVLFGLGVTWELWEQLNTFNSKTLFPELLLYFVTSE